MKLPVVTLFVYGIPIILWSLLPYTSSQWGTCYHDILAQIVTHGSVQATPLGFIFDVLLVYCIYLTLPHRTDRSEDRVFFIWSGLEKLADWVFDTGLRGELDLNKDEKTSLLFYVLKIYFTPLMVGYLVGNIQGVLALRSDLSALGSHSMQDILSYIVAVLPTICQVLFKIILVIDTAIFTFGYFVESKRLNSTVISVDSTAFGWFIALLCYPPVSMFSGSMLGWYSGDFSEFGNVYVNLITAVISVALFTIYVAASIALGAKASNLTNRGIVAHGPYKYVRHPAYVTKNISWLIMGIPAIFTNGAVAIISLSAWAFIYYLRALTEERHLAQDPAYREYMKKVPYRFIPGVL